MVCNKQKRVSKQEPAGGTEASTGREQTETQSHKNNRGEHQWPFAKERHGVFGKEICLVKNKQHKTAPKRKKRLNPAKEGHDKFLFNQNN